MIVYLTVLCRLVTYTQIARIFFRDGNPSGVRKAAYHLEQLGWAKRWNTTSRSGRMGHLMPTRQATDIVLRTLRSKTGAQPWARAVSLMLPRASRGPLDLRAQRPKWFAHQYEVNQLATAIILARRPLWISTWDSPFPPSPDPGLSLPQPDYVSVEDTPAGTTVIFGEHDRASEPLDRFIERKLRTYARLSGRAAEILGVGSFRVDVTVVDPIAQAPRRRLKELSDAAREFGVADLFRFNLAGQFAAELDASQCYVQES